MQGKFITIYGINNIGKSTQAAKLVERLKRENLDVVLLKYPIYDLEPTGPKINKILRESQEQPITEAELQTLFTQNRKDFEPTLKKMLADGKIVIAEDYTGTGIAWGTAKGLDLNWSEDLNKDLLREDLAILLIGQRDLRAQEKHHLHEQNEPLVQKVAGNLLNLAKKYGWKVIQVQPEMEDTAELIWKELEGFLSV